LSVHLRTGRKALMKTIEQQTYGPAEAVLVASEAPIPTPSEGQVLVRVRATSINTPDWITTRGVPRLLRLGSGLFGPKRKVRGSDVAGVVEALGPGVEGLTVGERVFGSVWTGGVAGPEWGTFAEYTLAPARQLAPIPADVSFEEAAGAVMSGVTALQALRDVAQVRPGHKVLINGASGGLGLFAVQLAKALGAEVTGVCSARNVELVRSAGAHHVLDYARVSYVDQPERYDVVLDNVLNHAPADSERVLAPGGLLLLNSIGSGEWVGSIPTMIFASLFKSKQRKTVQFDPSRENLDALAQLLRSKAVRTVIDSVWPLADAGKAVSHMASHRARGKIVLTA
jgi:NADPH:quinone reductase-like Zn-dependent oxidoreductase